MKKITKFRLSGNLSILSTAEQKQLVGRESDGCYGKTQKKCAEYSHKCLTDGAGQAGYCGWNPMTYNCECMVS